MNKSKVYQVLTLTVIAVTGISFLMWFNSSLPERPKYTPQAPAELCVKGVLYFERKLTPVYDAHSLKPIMCEEIK